MNFSDKNSRGFTLIELLVVIAIIGLLSSVVFASLNAARVKGRGITEEFAAVVDDAVAVSVEHQKAVIWLDPAGGGLDAVAIVVEEDGGGAGGDAEGFDALDRRLLSVAEYDEAVMVERYRDVYSQAMASMT